MNNDLKALQSRLEELEDWQAKTQSFMADLSIQTDRNTHWIPHLIFQLIKRGVLTEQEAAQIHRAVDAQLRDDLSAD